MHRTGIYGVLFTAAVFLVAGSPLWAQHAGHGAQSGTDSGEPSRSAPSQLARPTGRTEGTLVSQSEDSITIETAQGSQTGMLTYTLNGRTEFRGAIRVGLPVSVTYVEQGGMRAASKVEGARRKTGC